MCQMLKHGLLLLESGSDADVFGLLHICPSLIWSPSLSFSDLGQRPEGVTTEANNAQT